jgi:1,4-alpha-glucan branching enzyme
MRKHHKRLTNEPVSLWKDHYLATEFRQEMEKRSRFCAEWRSKFLKGKDLLEFANWHEFFGLHRLAGGDWCFREWLPKAVSVALIGEFSAWQRDQRYELQPAADGCWYGYFPPDAFRHGQQYQLKVHWPGGEGWRLPSCATRTVRAGNAAGGMVFNAQVWEPEAYHWQHDYPGTDAPLLIYEAHIGMAQAEERVGTFREFKDKILPRIAETGYTCLQLMAIAQHPYYASFGYQVANFYAPCDLFGTPEELKELVDAAHGMGLRVIMDLVHSHAVRNELEGLANLCGDRTQFFHPGPRGEHPAWGSYCFQYGKPEVVRFLLSNCRYWLEEYHFDGFRFDGVTSMLYLDHGLGRVFTSYQDYFGPNCDWEAWNYLTMANELVRKCRKHTCTIAEEVSGMPGLGAQPQEGGCGFTYRLAMGIADYWFILLDRPEQDWPLEKLWFELNNRRQDERTISYVECHDQAMVGGQTFLFRCLGEHVYNAMHRDCDHPTVLRGVALHKMARLATMACAGHGYMTFMGNEFGHPEWIDFPREGNNWSYKHACRRWDLADDQGLKYHCLWLFEQQMLNLCRRQPDFFSCRPQLLKCHDSDKVLIFERASLLFAFNFHPRNSYPDYACASPPGSYRLILDSDAEQFAGLARLQQDQTYFTRTMQVAGALENQISLYLPAQTALVLNKVD